MESISTIELQFFLKKKKRRSKPSSCSVFRHSFKHSRAQFKQKLPLHFCTWVWLCEELPETCSSLISVAEVVLQSLLFLISDPGQASLKAHSLQAMDLCAHLPCLSPAAAVRENAKAASAAAFKDCAIRVYSTAIILSLMLHYSSASTPYLSCANSILHRASSVRYLIMKLSHLRITSSKRSDWVKPTPIKI